MPIYEFRCKKCNEISSFIMKISDTHPPEGCQSCQSDSLVKIMSRTNFVLKGQGWYETDFKDKKNQTKEKTKTTKSPEKSTSAEPSKSKSNDSTKKKEPAKDSKSN